MDKFDDIADPLDMAFALPKAGKKLKPGETLPGLESSSERHAIIPEPSNVEDAALSTALDDAFSNPDFGENKTAHQSPDPVYVEDTAAIDAKISRDLDDAFANPKVGNKIEEGSSLTTSGLGDAGLQSMGLEMPRTDDLQFGQQIAKPRGFFGPKLLMIGMVLAVVVVAVVMGGAQTTSSTPTILRLD